MRVKGNIWEDNWHNAKACPVRRQKRLFDETKEAEKVISESLSVQIVMPNIVNGFVETPRIFVIVKLWYYQGGWCKDTGLRNGSFAI